MITCVSKNAHIYLVKYSINFFSFSISVNRDRGMHIDPDLIAYAYRRHDVVLMSDIDQVRLAVLYLEIDRIRIEVRGFQYQEGLHRNEMNANGNEPPRARCPVCYEILNGSSVTVASQCGHIFCSSCFQRLNNPGTARHHCALCRSEFNGPADVVRYYIRFNRGMAACRWCRVEFNPESGVRGFRCGDVFCHDCATFQLQHHDDGCYGCGAAMNDRNRMIRLHLSFI